jgi:hypothetical protein
MNINEKIDFAYPYAIGYLDGRMCGVQENRHKMELDLSKYAYSLGYDRGVAEYMESEHL